MKPLQGWGFAKPFVIEVSYFTLSAMYLYMNYYATVTVILNLCAIFMSVSTTLSNCIPWETRCQYQNRLICVCAKPTEASWRPYIEGLHVKPHLHWMEMEWFGINQIIFFAKNCVKYLKLQRKAIFSGKLTLHFHKQINIQFCCADLDISSNS